MVRSSFKTTKNGTLITFESIAATKAEALTQAQLFAKANDWHIELTLCCSYFPPTLCNFQTHEYTPNGLKLVREGCAKG